jgi:hypothetical protein
MSITPRVWLLAMLLAAATATAEPAQTPDLTPVRFLPAADHAPVVLVRDGAPKAQVYVAEASRSSNLNLLIDELLEVVRLTSGAQLTMAAQPPPADQPAIIIGDCEESRQAGIVAADIPIEGFVIKTAAQRIFLVGSTKSLPTERVFNIKKHRPQYVNDGTAWAVADFLERSIGVRWYWPVSAGGRSILEQKTLTVSPVHYTDQPVFRMRDFSGAAYKDKGLRALYFHKEGDPTLPLTLLSPKAETVELQPMLAGLREGNSWPYVIKVHEPQKLWKNWDANLGKHPELHDMFALKADGTRHFSMFCYSSPKTLDYLLKGCEDRWDHDKPVSWVTATCVTISPADHAVQCFCEPCRKLWEPDGGTYGRASKTMGVFVKRMCEEVKKRWPDKRVIYLPYWNYTNCPEDFECPDNLEIQMCTMAFGLMRQGGARANIQKQLRAWSKVVGGKITTWEYSHRVPEWTNAPVQYPHLVQDYYRANRDILAGSYLNAGTIREWSTGAPTNYVWMKVLWNPDVDVDAILDRLCSRMFGKAGGTCQELLRLQCERFETTPWPQANGDVGYLRAGVFQAMYPPEVVAAMTALRDRARREMAGDALAERRFAYWTWTFDRFLNEAQEMWAKRKVDKTTGVDGPGEEKPAGNGAAEPQDGP